MAGGWNLKLYTYTIIYICGGRKGCRRALQVKSISAAQRWCGTTARLYTPSRGVHAWLDHRRRRRRRHITLSVVGFACTYIITCCWHLDHVYIIIVYTTNAVETVLCIMGRCVFPPRWRNDNYCTKRKRVMAIATDLMYMNAIILYIGRGLEKNWFGNDKPRYDATTAVVTVSTRFGKCPI